MSKLRKTAFIFCLLGAVWFLIPLCIGMLHIGMVYPTVLLLLFAGMLRYPDKVKSFFSRHKVLSWIGGSLLAVVLAMILIPVGMIVSANMNNAPPKDATVVVLGCQVVGETPSLILQDRCDKAIEYLENHPDAKCVATGGIGNRATISEAQAIFNYMTARGIDPQRIFLEEQATNTCENLSYSAEMIKQQGLSQHVAIVSDDFHQWRGAFFAEKNGLIPFALGCPTRLTMAPGYWAREVAAIYKALLLGY